METGRPTEYRGEETIQATLEYINNCPDKLPSVVGLAIQLGVTARTIQTWVKDPEKEGFLRTLDMVKDAQHCKALNNGIDGTFNATITKLVLANFGYHEKQEVVATISNTDLTDEQLNHKLEALKNAGNEAD